MEEDAYEILKMPIKQLIFLLQINMILPILIEMILKELKKNQAKLKLATQNLLKIKKVKDTLIYIFFCLN